MPQKDMSSQIGHSSSPIVDRVIQNSKAGQKPVSAPGVVNSGQHNKAPVSK